MYFRILIDDRTGCVSYLLADQLRQRAVLVDPRPGDRAVLQAMLSEHRLQLQCIVCTHSHPGSEPDQATELQAWGVDIVRGDAGAALPKRLHFGKEQLDILATPGHTEHCLSCLWRDRMFCGGTLAAAACPHQPQPAVPEALWDSVTRKLFTLPAETLLFSGHARGTWLVSTVLEQRQQHPWFAHASRDEFLARLAGLSSVQTSPGQRINLPASQWITSP